VFIEVHISNNDTNLEKYDSLFESGEVQKLLGKNYFPQRILLVSDIDYQIKLKHSNIIRLDTKLNQFLKLFM
jgi:hypothetical protein